MLVTADKIAAKRREDFVNRHHTVCCSCEVTLRESSTGCRDTADGAMCSDCYFKMISNHVDSHPVIAPRDVE